MDEGFQPLLAALAQAKRLAATTYRDCASLGPPARLRLALEDVARDEWGHADQLDSAPPDARALQPDPAGRGRQASWPSALMEAFAIDQAVTGALVAMAQAPSLRPLCERIIAAEQAHQDLVVGVFRALAEDDAALGWRLGREMIEARDWIHQVHPRRARLVDLVDAGLLPEDAPRAHDAFLANLGDRIQDALGVLGEF